MTTRDFQIEFERRLQLMDPQLAIQNKLTSDTIFSFLNEAIDKFCKTRYSGLNTKREGFEQSQKRIDDLRSLVKSSSLKINGDGNVYTADLPEDYWMLLGNKVSIIPTDENNCWPKDDRNNYIAKTTDVLESTIETIDRQLSNTLSEHVLKYNSAKPLQLIEGNSIKLYTDGKYKVVKYDITYLHKPTKLNAQTITTEYTDLPEHTHIEIVKMAVQIYLATKPMEHYSVYSAEVNTME